MAWRGVHISRPARLSLQRNALLVEQRDETGAEQPPLRLPLEDTAWIVLDTQQVSLTAQLLGACMAHGVPVVISDARHTPCGVALPFHQHYQQADVAHVQAAAGDGLKRRLWKHIVQAKIANQSRCLDRAGKPRDARPLRAMAERVKPGDPDNLEARAARNYWPALFPGFSRSNESDRRNALLNYGYTVTRAGIARSLSAFGLLPAFGLHHRGKMNAFNLADDLIEPYRPLVDWMVYDLTRGEPALECGSLSLSDRRVMAGVLSADVRIGGQKMQALNAAERSAETLVTALRDREPSRLLLPETCC